MNSGGSNSLSLARALRRARRYRIAAMVIFLAGLVGAGVVYWTGSRAKDYSNDPEMLGFNRAEQRQMAQLYGKQGQLIEDLENLLKQPGTQAVLMVVAAGVVAAGCFQFSRMLEWEAGDREVSGGGDKLPG